MTSNAPRESPTPLAVPSAACVASSPTIGYNTPVAAETSRAGGSTHGRAAPAAPATCRHMSVVCIVALRGVGEGEREGSSQKGWGVGCGAWGVDLLGCGVWGVGRGPAGVWG